MEAFKKYLAPLILAVAVFLFFIAFKKSPSEKLWKGYTMLSVPAESDEATVIQTLDENNCGDYLALEKQDATSFARTQPFSFPELSGSNYLESRKAYFFDKERTHRIYYIPDQHSGGAKKAVRDLQGIHHLDAALGSPSSFLTAIPLVCLFVALVFLFYAENKRIFAAASFPAVLFVFCNPFYQAAAAVCLELYALFLCQRVWRRRGAGQAVFKNPFALVFFAASVLASFCANFLAGFFFVLNLFCAVSLLFLLYNVEVRFERGLRFLPVPIRSASRMNLAGCESVKKMLFSGGGIFVLLLFLLFGTNFSSIGRSGGLFFPAPTEYNGRASDFPSLDDYFVWEWNCQTMPYRSLNKARNQSPVDGESVVMTRFEKSGGTIKSRREVLFTFGDEFRKSALDALDKTENGAIEKLWKRQEKKFSVKYSAGSSRQSGPMGIIVLVLALFVPLGEALLYILVFKRGSYVS